MASPRWWRGVGFTGDYELVSEEIGASRPWVKVMQNRSRKAAHYGRLVEEAAAKKYDLDLEHTSWFDARAADGTPVECKGAMLNRRDGKTGRFRVFERYHQQLEADGGAYVFVGYLAHGRGIRVKKIRSLEAGALDLDSLWTGAGGHRESRQAKIPVGRIF